MANRSGTKYGLGNRGENAGKVPVQGLTFTVQGLTNGERYTRVAPYGYRWRDGRAVPVPKERRTLALMQRLRADGWSYVCIAADLDRRAIKARCRRKWNWSSVRAALRNTMRETEAVST